jgi:hypothetical protein
MTHFLDNWQPQIGGDDIERLKTFIENAKNRTATDTNYLMVLHITDDNINLEPSRLTIQIWDYIDDNDAYSSIMYTNGIVCLYGQYDNAKLYMFKKSHNWDKPNSPYLTGLKQAIQQGKKIITICADLAPFHNHNIPYRVITIASPERPLQ